MTIDEAIEQQRRLEEDVRLRVPTHDKIYAEDCKKWADEHKQIAEWLEELKLTRKIIYEYSQDEELITAYKIGVKDGREEVIDKIVRILEKRSELGECDYEIVERIEQLKEKNDE